MELFTGTLLKRDSVQPFLKHKLPCQSFLRIREHMPPFFAPRFGVCQPLKNSLQITSACFAFNSPEEAISKKSLIRITSRVVVVVVEILFRIADQTGRFAQYYDGDIIREVNSKEMKCLVHVVYHQ